MSGLASAANIPELRKRAVFTLLMLLVYRMGVQIPTPGINGEALSAFFCAKCWHAVRHVQHVFRRCAA
jgi:preprotein translocase subunit SecY